MIKTDYKSEYPIDYRLEIIEYFEKNADRYFNEINKTYSTYTQHGFRIYVNENLS